MEECNYITMPETEAGVQSNEGTRLKGIFSSASLSVMIL